MISEAISRLMGAMSGKPMSGGSCGCGPKPGHSDSHMITKSLEALAAQATEIRSKMECGGVELPSWAEYKVYKAHDAIKDALSATFTHKPKAKMMIVIRKAHDDGAKKALEDAGLSHSVTGEKTASAELQNLLDKLANLRLLSGAGSTGNATRTVANMMKAPAQRTQFEFNQVLNAYKTRPSAQTRANLEGFFSGGANTNLQTAQNLQMYRNALANNPGGRVVTAATKTADMREDWRNFVAENPSMNPWKDTGVGVLSMNLDDGTATAHTSGEMPVSDKEDVWRRRLVGALSGGVGLAGGGLLGGLAGTGLGRALDLNRDERGNAALIGALAGGLLGGAGLGAYGYRHGKIQDEHASIRPEEVAEAMQRLNALQGVRVPSMVQDPGGDSLRFYHHDAPDTPETIHAINRAIHGE